MTNCSNTQCVTNLGDHDGLHFYCVWCAEKYINQFVDDFYELSDPYNGKYCKDCKHWNDPSDHSAPYGHCMAQVKEWHCVYGPQPPDAHKAREFEACGPEGKLWEPKND